MIKGLSNSQKLIKRLFDLFFSLVGLLVCFPIILLAYLVASIETKSSGLFYQQRVGLNGKLFYVFKLKTMSNREVLGSTVTQANDVRITKTGKYLRNYKIDELPQLINVLIGNMSFVGPRPDVPGFADMLVGEDRIILLIKPGITGPASLVYKNEEDILAKQSDPISYNQNVIYPQKVEINKSYISNWSLFNDIKYILKTIG